MQIEWQQWFYTRIITLFDSYEPGATSIVFIAIEISSIDSHLLQLPLIGFNWSLSCLWFILILWIHLNLSQLWSSTIRINTTPPSLTMTLILKTPVILKSLKDWKVWYEIICSSVQAREILSLINVNVISLRQLIRLIKLNYIDVKPDAQLYAGLNAD